MNIRNFIFAGAVCAAYSLAAFGQTVPKSNPPATTTNSMMMNGSAQQILRKHSKKLKNKNPPR